MGWVGGGNEPDIEGRLFGLRRYKPMATHWNAFTSIHLEEEAMSEQSSPEAVSVKPHTRRRSPRKPKPFYVRWYRAVLKFVGLR